MENRKNLNIWVDKNGDQVMTFYHSYVAERRGFLDDLFRQTKTFRALQGGRINEIATLWVNNKHPLPYSLFPISYRLLWGICQSDK
jgi:hypothetical protein